jgi:pilus assembly protein CpaB
LTNKSKIIFMIIAGLFLVALGIFASLMLVQRFQADQASEVAEVDTIKTPVVIMTRDLFLGDTISEGDVQIADVPVEFAPRNAIATLDEVVGKMIKTDLIQGEMVLSNNLADPTNNNKDLSFILSDDHVLMAFPGDDLMSRESMVQRGDIVDIFATFTQEVLLPGAVITDEDAPPEPILRTFTVDTLQKVDITALVLDVIEQETDSGFMGGENTQPPSAHNAIIRAYLLALNPQDAMILKHLKDTGAIFDIVLRAPTSTVQFDLTPVTEEFIIEFYGLEILP